MATWGCSESGFLLGGSFFDYMVLKTRFGGVGEGGGEIEHRLGIGNAA